MRRGPMLAGREVRVPAPPTPSTDHADPVLHAERRMILTGSAGVSSTVATRSRTSAALRIEDSPANPAAQTVPPVRRTGHRLLLSLNRPFPWWRPGFFGVPEPAPLENGAPGRPAARSCSLNEAFSAFNAAFPASRVSTRLSSWLTSDTSPVMDRFSKSSQSPTMNIAEILMMPTVIFTR
ncbi:MAG: hypothetical protein EON58_01160 [Alphaproteobacteria bacterium]|nr:MAG: hypothetical protein EON58_01160 [Alphaproteobacteria bacterium]